jgi:F0F1-type ATP synthase assembly protein I
LTDPEQPQPDKSLPSAAAFLGMGLAAAICVGIGIGLGVWGDATWHTAPALLLVGMALGLAAAVWSVVTQIRQYL